MQLFQNNPSNTKPTEPPKEGYQWVINLMTGQWVEQEINTPHCCRVDCETYWSS
jgi:hypothetical protein